MNKKVNKYLLLCVAVVALIALSTFAWRKHRSYGVLAIPQFESMKEQKEFEHQALQGSPEAADKIVGVWGLFPSSDAFYWANIAAENNSRNGATNMSSFLSDTTTNGVEVYGDYRRDRQFYWTQKAAKNKEFSEIEKEYFKKEFPNSKEMQPPPEKAIRDWKLSQKTLPSFKRAAMRGSPEAAFRLYEHFSSPDSELKEGLFWAIIAAQNGHQGAPCAIRFFWTVNPVLIGH
jgi:TPR repeat protein